MTNIQVSIFYINECNFLKAITCFCEREIYFLTLFINEVTPSLDVSMPLPTWHLFVQPKINWKYRRSTVVNQLRGKENES